MLVVRTSTLVYVRRSGIQVVRGTDVRGMEECTIMGTLSVVKTVDNKCKRKVARRMSEHLGMGINDPLRDEDKEGKGKKGN